jgi:tetratricopeptide (TPR) repeat protein
VIGNSRVHLPDALAVSYIEEARRLRELGRVCDAETILWEGIKCFPDNSDLLFEHARLAERRRDWAEVAARWHNARLCSPDRSFCYVGEAWGLRELGRFDEADAMLHEALARFPGEAAIIFDLARIAQARHDPSEALARWNTARSRFPDRWFCYIGEGWALRALARLDEAQELLREAIQRFPEEPEPIFDYGRVAIARQDWAEVARHWNEARCQFPDRCFCYTFMAWGLRETGHLEEAEVVLLDAMNLFPNERQPFFDYARISETRRKWSEALARWQEAQRRFPDEAEVVRRIFEANLRVLEVEAPSAELVVDQETSIIPVGATAETGELIAPQDLVMQFESLGGSGHGCEFGIFQRELGAEPLGLLRWADLGQDHLATALEAEFDGVGQSENTELFVPPTSKPPEYWTKDRRYWMAMRTFVPADDLPEEQMRERVCRRLQFLKRKLIEDLRAGDKVFVFKVIKRNLLSAEIDRIHRAMRRYGDNTLLYVRYEDAEHPNGTVEVTKPGLMIGYIDHFCFSPDNANLGMPVQSWLRLCTKAQELLAAR